MRPLATRSLTSRSIASAIPRTDSCETPLGRLAGWLYIVEDEEQGARSEFFFARSLPGAPVWARVTNGDEIVMEMVQIDRRQTER